MRSPSQFLEDLFCNSIVVVGTNTCKLGDLGKVLEMGTVLLRGEGRPIVGNVSLGDDTKVMAMPLKLCLVLRCTCSETKR